ncbi:MAG: hypothetical protein LBT00_13720 [Spirochaetaceae bacterium]|nr:hypothetical protein [Spirochaetaceae bacterium]
MDKEQAQKYRDFVKDAWEKAVNHKEGETIPSEEFLLFVDKEGMKHIEKSQSFRHIFKQHGNKKTEESRGQIAIKQSDIEIIPDIINDYTFVIKNIQYKGGDSTLYAKHGEGNTHIYIERTNYKNRTHISVSLFNLKNKKDKNTILKILASNHNYDISNAKILGRGGSNFPDTTSPMSSGTAANPVNPSDTSLSPIPDKKSSPRTPHMDNEE